MKSSAAHLPLLFATMLVAGCSSVGGFGDSPAVAQERALAQSGDVEKEYVLGVRYTNGAGVRKSDSVAAKWFRAAAEQGHPQAQYMLGVSLSTGRGVARDPEAAVVWWERAAESGYDRAQYQLGESYLNGRGVNADPAWAARWFGKAAEQGHTEAQLALGVSFAKGLGLPQHPGEAAKWLTLAERAGNPLAGEILSRITPAERNAGLARAARWRTKTGSVFADRPTVRYVQFELKSLGYPVGPVDGVNGAQTQSAVAAYRRSAGMTGRAAISLELLHRLRRQNSSVIASRSAGLDRIAPPNRLLGWGA